MLRTTKLFRWNSTFQIKGKAAKPSQLNRSRNARLRRGGKLTLPKRMKRSVLKVKPETSAERKWKHAVRERDDYTCQRCFQVRWQYIHAHHIAPRSQRPDLKLEVSNGICLCFKCHTWVHNNPIKARRFGLLSNETYEKAKKAE